MMIKIGSQVLLSGKNSGVHSVIGFSKFKCLLKCKNCLDGHRFFIIDNNFRTCQQDTIFKSIYTPKIAATSRARRGNEDIGCR